MQYTIPVAFVVLFVAFQPGAAQDTDAKYKEVLQKLLESMGKMTETLEFISDEETAKGKRSILRVQVQEFLAVRKATESVAPPVGDFREKLAEEFRPMFEKANKALRAQIARVQRVPGGNAALQEIRGVFDKSAP